MSIKSLLSGAKVKVSMVAGVVVIATAYGTCTIDPDEDAVKEAVIKEVSEEAPKSEDPPEKPKEVEAPAGEDKKEDVAKEEK